MQKASSSWIHISKWYLPRGSDTRVKENTTEKLLKEIPKENETASKAYIRAFFTKFVADIPAVKDEFDKLRKKIN